MPSQPHFLLKLVATALMLIDQIHAAPIPFHPSSTSSLSVLTAESSVCVDGNNCRTTWDIIWSCAATIFLCTWVSYHPDVPKSTYTKSRATAIRIMSVIIAFLIPELVAAKAASDWRLARYHKPGFQGMPLYQRASTREPIIQTGWTQTHTHFALMGGFVGRKDGGSGGTFAHYRTH